MIKILRLIVCLIFGHNDVRIYNEPKNQLDRLIKCNFY